MTGDIFLKFFTYNVYKIPGCYIIHDQSSFFSTPGSFVVVRIVVVCGCLAKGWGVCRSIQVQLLVWVVVSLRCWWFVFVGLLVGGVVTVLVCVVQVVVMQVDFVSCFDLFVFELVHFALLFHLFSS